MAGLIKENVNTKLDQIVTFLFAGNRMADRAMSVLDVKFVMSKTSNILHNKYAHLLPLLADRISEYQSDRNMLTVYGLTPRDDTDYTDPLEIFNKFVEYQMQLEDMINEAYVLSVDEDDCFTHAFLMDFMRQITPVTKQCLLLLDKASKYNDWMQFDRDIKNFITL